MLRGGVDIDISAGQGSTARRRVLPHRSLKQLWKRSPLARVKPPLPR